MSRFALIDPASQGGDVDGSNAKDPAEMHGVLVSHRCLNKFLNSHVVSTTTIACMCPPLSAMCLCAFRAILTGMRVGICENHCVILYVYIGNVADAGGVLTYYIPAKFDDAM